MWRSWLKSVELEAYWPARPSCNGDAAMAACQLNEEIPKKARPMERLRKMEPHDTQRSVVWLVKTCIPRARWSKSIYRSASRFLPRAIGEHVRVDQTIPVDQPFQAEESKVHAQSVIREGIAGVNSGHSVRGAQPAKPAS